MKNYDYSKLRGRIRECLGSEGKFARAIGRHPNHISRILNNERYFNQNDISLGAEVLDIGKEEIGEYFFKEVTKNC